MTLAFFAWAAVEGEKAMTIFRLVVGAFYRIGLGCREGHQLCFHGAVPGSIGKTVRARCALGEICSR
jgi:hypothetical protein